MKHQLFRVAIAITKLAQSVFYVLIGLFSLGGLIILFGGTSIWGLLPNADNRLIYLFPIILVILLLLVFSYLARLLRHLLSNFSQDSLFTQENQLIVKKIIAALLAWAGIQLFSAVTFRWQGLEQVSELFNASLTSYLLNALFLGISLVVLFILHQGQVVKDDNDDII